MIDPDYPPRDVQRILRALAQWTRAHRLTHFACSASGYLPHACIGRWSVFLDGQAHLCCIHDWSALRMPLSRLLEEEILPLLELEGLRPDLQRFLADCARYGYLSRTSRGYLTRWVTLGGKPVRMVCFPRQVLEHWERFPAEMTP